MVVSFKLVVIPFLLFRNENVRTSFVLSVTFSVEQQTSSVKVIVCNFIFFSHLRTVSPDACSYGHHVVSDDAVQFLKFVSRLKQEITCLDHFSFVNSNTK